MSLEIERSGALVVIDGAGQCETPCTIKLDGPQRARIAKAGFVTQNVTLSPGKKQVVVPLQLAAASDDVDTTELPELEN